MYLNHCPICQTSKIHSVFNINYSQSEYNTTLYQCDCCDYHFVNPQPSDNFLDNFYDNEYGCFAAPTVWSMNALEKRVERIERYQRIGRLLDVGCGTGNFCLAAQNRGWEVWGVEPSTFAIEKVNESIRQQIRIGTIFDIDKPKNYFDAVTYWAVIEHLKEPMPSLKKAVELLKPGGVLLLQLPHVRSLAAKVYQQDWRLLKNSPDHVGFITKKTVEYICIQFSLQLVSVEIHGMPFPFGKIVTASPDSVNQTALVGRKSWTSELMTKIYKSNYLANLTRKFIHLSKLGDDIEFTLQKGLP